MAGHPQIVDSIAMLFTNFPSYIQSIQDMLGMAQERFGVDLSSATKVLDDSEAMVKEIYSMASAAMPQIVESIGSVASNFVGIFTSVAASIYMLADKNHLLHQLRTLAHAFLPEKAAENTLRICHYANVNFTGFFCGQDHRLGHHRRHHLCGNDDPAAGLCTAHQCVYRHHEHHPGVRPLHRRDPQHLHSAVG